MLEELIEVQDKICGLVIEFHDIDLHIEKINNFINSFKLTLTHIHPNNYGATDPSGNPTVIELTFEKTLQKFQEIQTFQIYWIKNVTQIVKILN